MPLELSVPYFMSRGQENDCQPHISRIIPTFTLLPTEQDFLALKKEYEKELEIDRPVFHKPPNFGVRLLIGSLHFVLLCNNESVFFIQHEASMKEPFSQYQYNETFDSFDAAIKFIKEQIEEEIEITERKLAHMKRIVKY